MPKYSVVKNHKAFGGELKFCQHESIATQTTMNFSVYLPEIAATTASKRPALVWLSGLTCNEENFVTKAGALKKASDLGVVLVMPDTSPRGKEVEDDEAYDFGQGAGFYVNSVKEPWSKHFKMYDYIVNDLYSLICSEFPLEKKKIGIFGHSMGGHGAITIGLRNPEKFSSISAFAPICAPSRCQWGQKAFSGYLGEDENLWRDYDSCELIGSAVAKTPLLVDQGDADQFLADQLRPELLEQACRKADHPLDLRMRPGFDHSYYFISTFINEHFDHHQKYWR